MKKKLTPDEVAKYEQKLDGSSLDEDTKGIIKGLIAGQSFLLDLAEKLVASSGHQRTKVILELAKILGIDPKKKNNNQFDNSSEDSSAEDEDKGDPEKDDQENTEEDSEKDSEKEEKDPPKRKHPKRGNAEFQPVASHVHFHKNLEPGDQCPECLQGRVYPFREKVIPVLIGRSPLAYEEHRLQTLRCNACGTLFEPKLPKEIPWTGNSKPSAQAVLTLLHYKIGVPFASIAALQKMFHQDVSPAQLWDAVEKSGQVLEPIYHELEKQAANSRLFYTDDTTARVLSHYAINKKNREKRRRRKDPQDRVGTYSSLIIGCTPDAHEIYLFSHGRKYAGENLSDLLSNRDGTLKAPIQMKDASTMNVPADAAVIEAKCNAHAIRKFKDLKEIYPKWCGEVLRKYAEVNKIDQMLLEKGVNGRERLAHHKKYSLPLMNEIKEYLTNLINDKVVEPNSTLGEAIAYFRSHYKELTAFCHIEAAPFDNNKSERGLKMIIRRRKISMFYKTEHGAEVAGMHQSVLFTAQEAGVNVLTYLQTILENLEEVRKNPSGFLPWTFQKNMEGIKVDLPVEGSLIGNPATV